MESRKSLYPATDALWELAGRIQDPAKQNAAKLVASYMQGYEHGEADVEDITPLEGDEFTMENLQDVLTDFILFLNHND